MYFINGRDLYEDKGIEYIVRPSQVSMGTNLSLVKQPWNFVIGVTIDGKLQYLLPWNTAKKKKKKTKRIFSLCITTSIISLFKLNPPGRPSLRYTYT